jgi:hypothetical protein
MNSRKLIVLPLIVAFSSLSAQATQVKVMRKKGKYAIVSFEGPSPEPGTVLSVQDPSEDFSGTMAAPKGARDNLVDFSTALAKPLIEDGGFSFSTAVRYGWNLGQIEVGPGLSFSKSTGSPVGFGLLGFLDFNFFENTIKETFVPGLSLTANFDRLGANAFGGSAGLFGKFWFLRASQSALRVDAKMSFSKVSGLDGMFKSLSLGVGIETYF